jgi:hypothetical protein
MLSKNQIKIIGFISMLALSIIYAYYDKIPIMCYGCEKPEGTSAKFFRCINDTSENSPFCEMSKNLTADNIRKKINEFIKNVSDDILRMFNQVKNIIGIIFTNIKTLISDIINIFLNFKRAIFEMMQSLLEKVKDIAVFTAKSLYNLVIKPIKEFIMMTIVNPIIKLITEIIKLKNYIIEIVSKVYEKIVGLKDDIYNNFSRFIRSINLPSNVFEDIDAVIDRINIFLGTAVRPINEAMKIVGKIVEKIPNLPSMDNVKLPKIPEFFGSVESVESFEYFESFDSFDSVDSEEKSNNFDFIFSEEKYIKDEINKEIFRDKIKKNALETTEFIINKMNNTLFSNTKSLEKNNQEIEEIIQNIIIDCSDYNLHNIEHSKNTEHFDWNNLNPVKLVTTAVEVGKQAGETVVKAGEAAVKAGEAAVKGDMQGAQNTLKDGATQGINTAASTANTVIPNVPGKTVAINAGKAFAQNRVDTVSNVASAGMQGDFQGAGMAAVQGAKNEAEIKKNFKKELAREAAHLGGVGKEFDEADRRVLQAKKDAEETAKNTAINAVEAAKQAAIKAEQDARNAVEAAKQAAIKAEQDARNAVEAAKKAAEASGRFFVDLSEKIPRPTPNFSKEISGSPLEALKELINRLNFSKWGDPGIPVPRTGEMKDTAVIIGKKIVFPIYNTFADFVEASKKKILELLNNIIKPLNDIIYTLSSMVSFIIEIVKMIFEKLINSDILRQIVKFGQNAFFIALEIIKRYIIEPVVTLVLGTKDLLISVSKIFLDMIIKSIIYFIGQIKELYEFVKNFVMQGVNYVNDNKNYIAGVIMGNAIDKTVRFKMTVTQKINLCVVVVGLLLFFWAKGIIWNIVNSWYIVLILFILFGLLMS